MHECNIKCIRCSKSTTRSAFLVLKAPREGHNQQEYSSLDKKTLHKVLKEQKFPRSKSTALEGREE